MSRSETALPHLDHLDQRRPPLPLWAALVVAAASGPVLDGAFPDRGIWPLAFVGIAGVLVSLIGRRMGEALLVGFVAGCAFYFTHIQWASLFLGPLPMSALSVLEALFFAAGALAIALAYRWIPRAFPGPAGRLGLLPVAVAGLWTAREAWASVWPYGGFAWGRVALSQSDSPLSPVFAWLGISGVSFAMVLLVAASVEAVRALQLWRSRDAGAEEGRDRGFVRALVIPVALATVMLVAPAFPVVVDGSLRVAAVQGAGKAGYFDGSSANELLQAQLDATVPLFGESVDLVLWPEGTTYADPLTDAYTAGVFDYVAERMDAPLIAQGITVRDGQYFNTSVLWRAGEGVIDLYDKRHPIPFGEYIPDRAFWRPFAPELIDLVRREYTPGTTDMVYDLDGTIVGVNICFDISDDQVLAESAQQGAQAIFAQTNNADFGRTDESAQQLAIARIRAIELGRSVVNISTVGISAVIATDGTIVEQLPWYEPGAMVQDIELSTTLTPAAAAGRQVEWLVSGIGLSALLIAGWAGRRRRA